MWEYIRCHKRVWGYMWGGVDRLGHNVVGGWICGVGR